MRYAMCTFVAHQHHSCRTIQGLEGLHSKETEVVVLCHYMRKWRSCHDGTAFWFYHSVKAASECESVHCVIHREMLASRKTAPELDDVLQDVTEMINHMEVRALRSRLFSRLREGMDAERTRLLSRTEVRWLLNRSLARVPEL